MKVENRKANGYSHHSSAPACYTWLISTSTAGAQQTYSLLACTDKPGTGTLLATDPASTTSSTSSPKSSSGSGGGKRKSNTGAIVGGVIAGLVGLLGIAAFAAYVLKQKRKGRAEDAAAEKKMRDSQEEWMRGGSGGDGGGLPGYGVVGAGEKSMKRKEVGGGAVSPDMEERSMMAVGAGQDRSMMTGGGTSPATTDRDGGVSPANAHLAYSVSSVSGTGSHAGTGIVSNMSPVPPTPHLAGVVEAPDTAVGGGGPVEVPGTTVTRETMQNRAELA